MIMASSKGRSSGQKYKFVSEPDDELKCLICLEVAMDPMQHEECGKLFCRDCLESHGRTKPCPNCRTKDSQYYKDNRSKISVSQIMLIYRYRIRAIFGGSLVWRLLSYIQLADIIIGGP